MSNQSFERLIRLEDEELGLDEEYNENNAINNDSCRVPMIPNGNQLDNSEDLFSGIKQRQGKIGGQGGFHFTINGRRIQMNPEQLKYLSLITLTVQNAALNLIMRAANTQKERFSTPVAVTLAEILKLITCISLVCYDEVSMAKACKTIKSQIIDNYIDTLKVAVPSFIYYIQNNLLYVGSTHLDAATGQVTYQLKILTTAVFSVLMLNKKLSKIQWTSLVILFIGVAMIESLIVTDNKSTSKALDADKNNNNETMRSITPDGTRVEKPLIGFLAILIAACLSGLAGVYFEKILKNSSQVSLWIRNIQLCVVAIPIGLIQVLLLEREHVTDKGLFYGFTSLTWLCVILQAQGGLLVAVVVKFANNILKGFATSMAIVISTTASMILFDFNLTPVFILGASLVIGSVMMYSKQ